MRYLFIRHEDFCKYAGFNFNPPQAGVTGKHHAPTVANKERLLKHTGQILNQAINHDGVDPDLFEGSAAFVETAVEVIAEDPEVFELLDALTQHTDYLYAHSLGTSLFSVILANKMAWTMPTNKFKVAVGGLLHDVGQKGISEALLMRPRGDWSADELKMYESHPTKSLEILHGIKSMSSDVLQIVKEHHEDCLSQGFPSRMRKGAIHPMAKLVSVANLFSQRIVKNPHNRLQTPKQALEEIVTLHSEQLDTAFLDALMRVFDFVPPGPKRRGVTWVS